MVAAKLIDHVLEGVHVQDQQVGHLVHVQHAAIRKGQRFGGAVSRCPEGLGGGEAVETAGQHQHHLHGLHPAAGVTVGGQGQGHAAVQHGPGADGAGVLHGKVGAGQDDAHHTGVPQLGQHLQGGVVQVTGVGHLHLGSQGGAADVGIGVGVDGGDQAVVPATGEDLLRVGGGEVALVHPHVVEGGHVEGRHLGDHVLAQVIDVPLLGLALLPAVGAQEGGHDVQG